MEIFDDGWWEQFFVLVFVIEAILKLIALGPVQYFKDEWNTFDFIVTALGVIEMCFEGVQGLSVLRAFRLVSGTATLYYLAFTHLTYGSRTYSWVRILYVKKRKPSAHIGSYHHRMVLITLTLTPFMSQFQYIVGSPLTALSLWLYGYVYLVCRELRFWYQSP